MPMCVRKRKKVGCYIQHCKEKQIQDSCIAKRRHAFSCNVETKQVYKVPLNKNGSLRKIRKGVPKHKDCVSSSLSFSSGMYSMQGCVKSWRDLGNCGIMERGGRPAWAMHFQTGSAIMQLCNAVKVGGNLSVAGFMWGAQLGQQAAPFSRP